MYNVCIFVTTHIAGGIILTDRFERFSYAISEIYHYWHIIAAEVLEAYGLKGSSAVYFTVLNRFPTGITASKLGELCSRNKADVSRVISQMMQKGFVYTDGRPYRTKLFLTAQGKEVAEHINERAEIAGDLGSAGLNEVQREAFYDALELIAANLKKIGNEGISNY